MKQKFDIIESTCVPLPLENVDTDQIIPARFLKATTRDERFFGENLFRDWRYRPDGTPVKDFVLNNPVYGGEIRVAGRNFGSGSSREHAAWAIAGYGFKVVISSFFANHLILCCPLLLLPSIFPSIRVFSNESVLCIRRPKYWHDEFTHLRKVICLTSKLNLSATHDFIIFARKFVFFNEFWDDFFIKCLLAIFIHFEKIFTINLF